jgi:LPS export ABC transporter protein LptC
MRVAGTVHRRQGFVVRGKLFLILLGALTIGTLVVLSYKENGVKTYPSYKTSSMRGFRLTHREEDKIKWELLSEKAIFPEGKKEVILKDLTMRIHQEYEIALRGGSGVYDIQRNNLIINRPVEIAIEEAKLTTDSLTWDGKEGLITTQNNITFAGRNFLIEGTGLTAKIKDQQIRILKDVKGTFYTY